jgi:L,D-transpeptidase catalytic domain
MVNSRRGIRGWWEFAMSRLRPLVAAIAATCFFAFPAAAKLLTEIDKSAQRMIVSQDGARLHVWPVSTGLRAHDTPAGSFTPFRMEKDHFSREWDDAPMPHSIFFTRQGHAIHGTEHRRKIGQPASHGCVRLEPENARVLFGLVRQEGMANTRVVLFGVTPGATRAPEMARRAPRYAQPGIDDDVTSAATPRRVERGYPAGQAPVYWGQPQFRPSDVYDGDAPYRRMPPPPSFYTGPRY